uniref:Uncharacterized protein n=1 Tax=Anopheles atroparvus TaxID=41427 RepID=A0A182IJ85_ANOAO
MAATVKSGCVASGGCERVRIIQPSSIRFQPAQYGMNNVADHALLQTIATSNYALSSIRCNGVAVAAATAVGLYSGRCPSWALCGANGKKRLYRDAFVNDGKKLRVMYDPFA